MAWVMLDDKLRSHPKVLNAGAEAAWMWVAAIGYCQEHLTDGFVPDTALATFGVFRGRPREIAKRAIEAGLFEVVEGGVRVHDYLHYNPSRTKVLEARETARRRKADYRASHEKTPTGVSSMSHEDTHGTGMGQGRPSRARVPAGLGTVCSVRSGEGLGEGFDAQGWFDRVYATYPNKSRKNAALAVWHRDIADEATARAILTDIETRLAHGWVQLERRFIPSLVRFLEERQWEDAPQPAPPPTPTMELPRTWACATCGGFHTTEAHEPMVCPGADRPTLTMAQVRAAQPRGAA